MGDTLASVSRASQTAPASAVAVRDFSAPFVVSALMDGPQGIRASLSESQRLQLSALAKESDESLFFQGLLDIAGALEVGDRLDLAATLYSATAQLASPRTLKRDAEARLNAMIGKGPVGNRAEFLLRRFTRDASDPKVIVPMLAGTAVYSLARSAALGRLTLGARGAWYSQGLGARLVASSMGFALEVPTFALSSRALRQIGTDGKTPQPGLDHELASAAITLGLLKGFGFAGQKGFARLHALGESGAATRLAAWTGVTRPLISQGSMFAGLLTAHRLEESVGLRPHIDGATTLTDTFASMLSLGVGAHLGNLALGPRFTGLQREMEVRAGLSLLRTSQAETKLSPRFPALTLSKTALGRLAATTAGLAAFLPERLAFAQASGVAESPNSEAQLMTWLSTAVVGGLLLWGGKKIRDHYVAPRGRIGELANFRSQLETTASGDMLARVRKAERYLQESKDYRRANDEAIAIEAFNFLGKALPKLEAKDRLASLEKIWDHLSEVGDHNRHLALRVMREAIPSLDEAAVERLAFRAKKGVRYEDFDRVTNAIFVLMMLMPKLAPEKRVDAAVAIHQALAGRATQFAEHLDWISKGRILLKDMQQFMDRRDAEEKQKLRQKIRELRKAHESGESPLDFSMEARVRRLEQQLENFSGEEEIDLLVAFQKHLREEGEEIPMMWDHRLALDYADKFQEIFQETDGPVGPAVPPATFKARLEQAQPYLKDGGMWLRRLYPQSLLKEINRFLEPADRASEEE